MQDLLSRLRAALTPQALAVLALALMIAGSLISGKGSGGSDSLEERASKTLSSVAGAGRVAVVIRMRETDDGHGTGIQSVPCGAVAVAGGAGDPIVRIELEQALCALLGLPASAVSVVEGGG